MRRLLVGVVAWVVAGAAYAQTCTGYLLSYDYVNPPYERRGTPRWYPDSSVESRAQACLAWISEHGVEHARERYQTDESDGIPTYENHAAVRNGTNGCSVRVSADRTSSPAGEVWTNIGLDLVQVAGQCPPEAPDCDVGHDNVGRTFTAVSFPGTCDAESHCKIEHVADVCFGGFEGASGCFKQYAVTSSNCDDGEPDEELPPPGESCAQGAEAEFCQSDDGASGPNCGFLNGNFVCLDQTDDDGCQVFGDGSRVCGPRAPTPPVPDNGTPGQPAPPDDVITAGDNIYNYYSSNTVNNSARDPGSSGDNPYDGEDDGTGGGRGLNSAGNPTSGGGDGDGGGVGGGECPEGATCDGSLPNGGEFEEVCTFGECASDFFARVQAAPLVASVLGVGAGFPAGSCPNWTLPAFGEDYLLSGPMCDIWDQVSPLLSAMFLIIWAWVATRIVLSA